MVFDKDWFIQHQRKLLWLSNTSIGRYLLRIYNDCPKGRRIVQILPNSYSWDNEDGTVTIDIRSHNKFAKRLYYGLKLIWYVLHFWDWLLADRWYPKLSFQFLTLTAFPSAGEVSPCDGWVRRNPPSGEETYAAIRSGAGDLFNATSSISMAYNLTGLNSGDSFNQLHRGIFMFDTSSIGDNDTINSAIFSLYGSNKFNNLSLSDTNAGLAVCAVTTASTSSLAASDYNISNWPATVYANYVAYSALSTTAYNDMSLNAVGLSNINKTGVTKIGTRMVIDIDNGSPTSIASQVTRFICYFADQTGTANDPKLVVTYTLAAFNQTLSGALVFVGVVTGRGSKTNTGSLVFVGVTVARGFKTLLGSVLAAGDILAFKGITQSLTGAISYSGAVLKQGLKSLIGGIESMGVILTQGFKSLVGGMASVGSVTAQKLILQVLSGAISFAGNTLKTVQKLITGTLSLAGSLGMATAKLLSGAISLTGGVVKVIGKTLAGVLSFIGNMLSGASDMITVIGRYQLYFSIAPNVNALITKNKNIDVLLTKNKNIDVLLTKTKNVEVNF